MSLEAASAPPPPGIVTKASRYPVAETLARLEAAVRQRGLQVFAHIDHSGEAQRAGLAMQPAHVLIFGSPKAGTPLMVASPLIALDLPLKALIWEGDDGQVRVGYYSPSYLAERYALPPGLAENIAGIGALVDVAVGA